VRLPPEAKGLSIVLGPFSRQANSSAPAGVNFAKVPDSCIASQPRDIAKSKPAPYCPNVAEQERAVDTLNVDAAIQDRFESLCVLHKAPGGLLVGVGTIESVYRYCLLRSPSVPVEFGDGGVGRLVVAAPVSAYE